MEHEFALLYGMTVGRKPRRDRWCLKLSALMRGQPWTLGEWNARTGIPVSTLANYREGRRFPKEIEDLERILSAMDTSVSKFFVAASQYPRDTQNLHELVEGLYRASPECARRLVDALSNVEAWLDANPRKASRSGGGRIRLID